MNDSINERVSRRNFLRAAVAVGATLTLPAAAREDKRPNIILFLTDDQDKHSI
jgi:hypothetical protein